MKYLLGTLYLLFYFSLCAQDNSSYVNLFIGTKNMGHTFPGACVPHGFVQLSPDTDTIPHNVNGVYQKDAYRYCAGYQYDDSTIVGFSHTHFNGTGHSDLGDILLMPTVGEIRLNPGTRDYPSSGYRSRFSHQDEKAVPGYYQVLLKDYKINAELTATDRVGVHRYTYPGTEGNVILDLNHSIYNYDGKVLWSSLRVENDTLLTGYRITNGWARTNYIYFAISFSRPIKKYGYVDDAEQLYKGFWRKFDVTTNFPEMAGRKLKSYFTFDLENQTPLEVKVALSGVSTRNAVLNLQQETAGRSFSDIATLAINRWKQSLSVINVDGDLQRKQNFYTSLYHTMIHPSLYMDVNGEYRGIDNNVYTSNKNANYSIFSLWDTFRALHPLFNLIDPQRSADMLHSLLAHYQQSVHKVLPVWSHMGNENWCMIGYHAVSLLQDGIVKGVPVDKKLALQAMLSSSSLPYYEGLGAYIRQGYVPLEESGYGASITLEYAYDDWTIYRLARLMDNKVVAENYKQRAQNYTHLFNKEIKYVVPRYRDGRWKENMNIYNTHGEGFIEGNSLNYSFFAPHDVKGLITCMGGDKEFVSRLDALFTKKLDASAYGATEDVTEEGIMGSYVHGNEPSHHIPYLYMWTSTPWKTAEMVRKICDEMYHPQIDGLCGNDDGGQMSAWYLFSSMGFYPVCPGSTQYVIGAPLFREVTIRLPNGKQFTIEAPSLSDKNKYVKSIRLNGVAYKKAYIEHSDIVNGGHLQFEMDNKPSKRKYQESEKPYSLTNDN